jgi:SAM-dependent methyltransferase
MDQVVQRPAEIDFADAGDIPKDLLVFYHRETLGEICALKEYLLARQASSQLVFRELHRVLRPGGHVAFEVGGVRKGRVKLEGAALACGVAAGLAPLLVIINDQEFTKRANCWGVDNNTAGTNTNRIVLFRKDA